MFELAGQANNEGAKMLLDSVKGVTTRMAITELYTSSKTTQEFHAGLEELKNIVPSYKGFMPGSEAKNIAGITKEQFLDMDFIGELERKVPNDGSEIGLFKETIAKEIRNGAGYIPWMENWKGNLKQEIYQGSLANTKYQSNILKNKAFGINNDLASVVENDGKLLDGLAKLKAAIRFR